MRRYPRAPLNSMILYLNKNRVYCSRGLDISPKALLMDNGSCPAEDGRPLLFGLLSYPDFSLMDPATIKAFSKRNEDPDFFFERTIFRLKAKKIRIARSCSAYEFIDISLKDREKIGQYISLFSKNMLFLLGFFEIPEHDPLAAKTLASLLGYGNIDEISSFRQRVLHDYQNIMV